MVSAISLSASGWTGVYKLLGLVFRFLTRAVVVLPRYVRYLYLLA